MNEIEKLIDKKAFRPTCVEEMRQEIARNYCDHQLVVNRVDPNLDGKFFKLPLCGMSVNYLSYGADVFIDAGDFKDFYMLEFPVSGGADLRLGKDEFQSSKKCGTLISPGVHVRSNWSSDCAQLMLKISKTTLRSYLQDILMQDVKDDVVFDIRVETLDGPGATLFDYLSFLISQSSRNEALFELPSMRRELEDSILAMLIHQLNHNYSDSVRASYSPALPRHVSKAYNYIKENAHLQITNEDLAKISNVSSRTLYAGFQQFLGMSPQACLRAHRLLKVKEELSASDSRVLISDLAKKWGFSHMGRFSRDFKNRFGVSPSEVANR